MMKTKLIQWQINRDDNQLKHGTPVNEGKELDTANTARYVLTALRKTCI